MQVCESFVEVTAGSLLLPVSVCALFVRNDGLLGARVMSRWSINDIGNAVVGMAMSHGVLALCSVIHHVPTVSPHREVNDLRLQITISRTLGCRTNYHFTNSWSFNQHEIFIFLLSQTEYF